MEHLSFQKPSLDQLELGNKLLHDRDNIDDVYFHFHEFVTNNNKACIDKIIEKDLHLFAKCFCDILKPTMNHLKQCKYENKMNLYSIFCSNYDFSVYDTVDLDDFDMFLKLITEQQPDIITYGQLAKVAILNNRFAMLEIILETIKLPFEVIDELYNMSDAEEVRCLFRSAEPDYILKKEHESEKNELEEQKKMQEERKRKESQDLLEEWRRKGVINGNFIQGQSNSMEIEQSNTRSPIHKPLERINTVIKSSSLMPIPESLEYRYLMSIKNKDHETFKQLHARKELFCFQKQALELAKSYDNQVVIDVLKAMYPEKTSDHYDELIKNAYDNNNVRFIDYLRSRCNPEMLHKLVFMSIGEGKLDILKSLIQNKACDAWILDMLAHAKNYNQKSLEVLLKHNEINKTQANDLINL